MKQSQINKILFVILVVSLVIGVTAMFLTRTTSRDATAEELEKYAAYDVLWDAMPEAGEGQSQKDRILALCTALEETQVGESQYSAYASETLGQHVYHCRQVDQILVSEDGVLYINYTDLDGLSVILGYDADGLQERSIYDRETDILYYELNGTVIVYEHFSSSAS